MGTMAPPSGKSPPSSPFLVTFCPPGLCCNLRCAVSKISEALSPPSSRMKGSSVSPPGQSRAGGFCPLPRTCGGRKQLHLGAWAPLSVPAASQHLGRGHGPGWTPGLSPSAFQLPTLGQGLEILFLLSNHLHTPPWEHSLSGPAGGRSPSRKFPCAPSRPPRGPAPLVSARGLPTASCSPPDPSMLRGPPCGARRVLCFVPS